VPSHYACQHIDYALTVRRTTAHDGSGAYVRLTYFRDYLLAYSLTLKMRDLNGFYSDSAPFSLNFTAIPEPGSVVWLGLAAFGWFRSHRQD
jgi:hypothetical protein